MVKLFVNQTDKFTLYNSLHRLMAKLCFLVHQMVSQPKSFRTLSHWLIINLQVVIKSFKMVITNLWTQETINRIILINIILTQVKVVKMLKEPMGCKLWPISKKRELKETLMRTGPTCQMLKVIWAGEWNQSSLLQATTFQCRSPVCQEMWVAIFQEVNQLLIRGKIHHLNCLLTHSFLCQTTMPISKLLLKNDRCRYIS